MITPIIINSIKARYPGIGYPLSLKKYIIIGSLFLSNNKKVPAKKPKKNSIFSILNIMLLLFPYHVKLLQ